MRLFPTTLYVAGPMTGLPELNYPAFMHAEKQLIAEGFRVLNPAKNKGTTWTDFMRASLRQLADADGVFFLNGWKNSKGAKLEHQIATELGLMIRYEPEPKAAQKSTLQSGEMAIGLTEPFTTKERELGLMAKDGASTAELGRELMHSACRNTSLNRTVVDARDLRAILTVLCSVPVSSPGTHAAYKRLQASLGL